MNIKDETMLLKNKLREINKIIKFKRVETFEEYDTYISIKNILRRELDKNIIPVYKNW